MEWGSPRHRLGAFLLSATGQTSCVCIFPRAKVYSGLDALGRKQEEQDQKQGEDLNVQYSRNGFRLGWRSNRSCLVSYDSSFLASHAKSFYKIGLALQQLWPINACLCLDTFYAPNLHPTFHFSSGVNLTPKRSRHSRPSKRSALHHLT